MNRKFEIKDIISPDYFDEKKGMILDFEKIPIQKDVSMGINIDIGPIGDSRYDTFFVTILSGKEVGRKTDNYTICLDSFDPFKIKEIIERIVYDSEDDTWEKTKERLKRRLQYEYE